MGGVDKEVVLEEQEEAAVPLLEEGGIEQDGGVIDRSMTSDEDEHEMEPNRRQSVCPALSHATCCPSPVRKAFRRVALWYDSRLQKQPLLTKSLTAFVILGAADLVGQAFQAARGERPDTGTGAGTGGLDGLRTLRFAVFGLVLQAPWNHYYYLLLDGALPPTAYPWTKRTFVKVFIDQFLQAPVFTLLTFLFLGTLQGNSFHQVWAQILQEYWRTMFLNCKCTSLLIGVVTPTREILLVMVLLLLVHSSFVRFVPVHFVHWSSVLQSIPQLTFDLFSFSFIVYPPPL